MHSCSPSVRPHAVKRPSNSANGAGEDWHQRRSERTAAWGVHCRQVSEPVRIGPHLLPESSVRASIAILLVLASAAGCSALPFHHSSNEKKAECDRIAAEAIQTTSLEDAKTLSARASACYAAQQQG